MNSAIRDNLNFLYGAPSCRVYNSANESITTATDTTVTFNSERWDNDTMHAGSSGTVTFTTAGRYIVISIIEFAANATGYRFVKLWLDATVVAQEQLPAVSVAASAILNVSTITTATAAQTTATTVYQTSGGALNVLATGNYSPEFMAHWMGN
mgnify:CR=1 FL=1